MPRSEYPIRKDVAVPDASESAPPRLRFDVPLIPDPGYLRFLAGHEARLHSVHFSLYSPLAADARHRTGFLDEAGMMRMLRSLERPKKYLLLNASFHAPELYANRERIDALAARIENLVEAGQLHGLVYVDQFLLRALSDAHASLCARLEALPGINCRLDAFDAIAARLDAIADTAFRPPSKLVLDRALNRRLPALRSLAHELRQAFPEMSLALMANEGCLAHCPFKPAHDSHVAHAAQDCGRALNYSTLSGLGCIRTFFLHPEHIFQSPFMRPEDIAMVAGEVDLIKICGRTRSPAALTSTVKAYLQGSWSGNLLDLLDTQEALADRLYVDNPALPSDFAARVGNCGQHCRQCGYCRELARRLVRTRAIVLEDRRNRT